MIKDGKYRYTLQFGMNTVEERQAGQFLEQLGNKKSPIIVAALNKYLEENPGLLDSQVSVQVHVSGLDSQMLEDTIRKLIEERLGSGVPGSFRFRDIICTKIKKFTERLLQNVAIFL